MVRSNPVVPADLVRHGPPATSIRRNKNASTPATTATPAASTDMMVVIRPQGNKRRGSNGTSSSSGLRVTPVGDARPHLEPNVGGCPQCRAWESARSSRW